MCSLALQSESVASPGKLRRERRLNAAIAEYLHAAQSGRAPDRRQFLDRYWDLTDGLASFFENEDRMKRFAGLPAALARAKPYPESRLPMPGFHPELSNSPGLGQFELLNEIARGGMGVVYKARHKRLNRVVALKTIRPGVSCSTDVLVRRLRTEAKVVAALDHPNIVPLYEIGEEDGYPYLILKLIPGGDLERHRGRLSRNPRAAVRLMAKVARTVHYAHSHGVLHRDLKPSNILLDLEGAPHVTDFGLARCIETESSLTQTGLILGTPAYMAPEQASGSPGELTEAVDVYGLGAVLYKLLAGRPPFQAETMYEVLEQVRERVPSSLRVHNRAIDRNLDAICLKCLQKDPARRYHSAAALSADLERWLAGSPVSARRPNSAERISNWYCRNRKAVAFSATLVGLVAAFVIAGIATATIICNYELAGDPRPRAAALKAPVPRNRSESAWAAPEASLQADSRGGRAPVSSARENAMRHQVLETRADARAQTVPGAGANPASEFLSDGDGGLETSYFSTDRWRLSGREPPTK
jgi:tRNA A-37 threonylcarbamoyl transferase component Bud32